MLHTKTGKHQTAPTINTKQPYRKTAHRRKNAAEGSSRQPVSLRLAEKSPRRIFPGRSRKSKVVRVVRVVRVPESEESGSPAGHKSPNIPKVRRQSSGGLVGVFILGEQVPLSDVLDAVLSLRSVGSHYDVLLVLVAVVVLPEEDPAHRIDLALLHILLP